MQRAHFIIMDDTDMRMHLGRSDKTRINIGVSYVENVLHEGKNK